MRQSCIKLLCIDSTLSLLCGGAAAPPEEVLCIFGDYPVVQIFFGFTAFNPCRRSCTTELDFSGVRAMISLAAATTIQKIADSKITMIVI